MLDKVTIEVTHRGAVDIERHAPYGWRPSKAKDAWAHDEWSVALKYEGRRYALPQYNTGIGWRRMSREAREYYQGPETAKKKITVKDVLESLFSDASSAYELFADFAENMGGNADSRKMLDTYLACQGAEKELRRLFGKDYNAIRDAVQE